ncbi:protein MMS22-like isoform X2 [Rhynchophorus ferrugineus]|uniref:protein MMS22-like isoform X2 n=1 Tax=Rhynchophorus ferrugineus TaxID=354439 RepID=UPI003FCD15C5
MEQYLINLIQKTIAVAIINIYTPFWRSLFWRVFNKVLEKEDAIISLAFLRDISSLQTFNYHFEDEGCKSNRIKTNFDFLEKKIKELLLEADCDALVYGLKIIEPLLSVQWLKEGRINIYQTIWDFYSKRLNISNKNSSSVSAIQLIDTLDAILYSPKNCKDDFEIFIGLLLYHLNEYPMQWTKIKGRIYSQLGPNKVKDLSEIGIRHVMLLFMALSTISFDELEKKMLVFIELLPEDKKFSSVAWNIYHAIILKYVRDGKSIENIAVLMVRMLQEASVNQKTFHLIKEFVKNLEPIILNSLNMNLHQKILFGSWLGKYLSTCYHPDLCKTLEVILLLIERCSDADSLYEWESCLKENIYVQLKQLALSHNPPEIIGIVAGKLALLYTNLTADSFNHFSNETISPSITSGFLQVILEKYPDSFMLTSQQENIIVQSWVKICFVSTENQIDLTKQVMKLDIFSADMKQSISHSDDPMEAFIKHVGLQSQRSYDHIMDLIKICDIAFNNLEKTLGLYVLKPENEAVVLNIYRYTSLLFLNCSKMIYNKNKSVTVLTKLVEVLLLPMDFMAGKRMPHSYVLTAIKNTWEVFFKAFMNVRDTNDPYIERILKYMVVKYIPYYSITESPIVSSLKTVDYASVIFEKMCISYFKYGTNETDANISKALKIIAEIINTCKSLPIFRVLVKEVLQGLFEVVIFHPLRSTAIGVIRNLTISPLFNEVTEEFKQTVLTISDKNVGLYTVNYFQLLISLAKFTPNEIRAVLDDIKIKVTKVEKLRGVGFDKILRTHLEKLENALQTNL